jgi:hypothetical protein
MECNLELAQEPALGAALLLPVEATCRTDTAASSSPVLYPTDLLPVPGVICQQNAARCSSRSLLSTSTHVPVWRVMTLGAALTQLMDRNASEVKALSTAT